MIESNVANADLLAFEPNLDEYYPSGQSDYATEIAKALTVLDQHYRSRGKKLRNLCLPLSLASAAPALGSFTSKSSEDIVERTRLVVVVTASTGTNIFTIYGTNDSTSETWTSVGTLTITTTGTKTTTFRQTFKYYRLGYTSGTSITITSAYLVEQSFELAHIYLTLHNIFRYQMGETNDVFQERAKMYWDLYQNELDTLVHSEDLNDDQSLQLGEETIQTRTTLRR